jgi:hypothetical protein
MIHAALVRYCLRSTANIARLLLLLEKRRPASAGGCPRFGICRYQMPNCSGAILKSKPLALASAMPT